MEPYNPRTVITQLKTALAECRQRKTERIAVYYGRISKLWEELSTLNAVPTCECNGCTCGVADKIEKSMLEDRLYMFLLGLDPSFASLRSQLLNQKPLPSIDWAYENLVHKEWLRNITGPVVTEDQAKTTLKQQAQLKELEQGHGAAADLNAGSGSRTDSGAVCAHHTTSPQPAASSSETTKQPMQKEWGLNSLTPDQCCSVMDDSELGSLYVVVFHDEDPRFSILQLERLEEIKNTDVDGLKENVVSFDVAKELPPIRWSISPPISCTGDLYLLPDWCAADKPLHGYKFNIGTGSFENMCLPPSIQKKGKIQSVVNLGGRLYRMERHYRRFPHYTLVESLFDCYDPVKKSWKALKPFPPLLHDYRVMATAVWGDTILFNVDRCGLWAYDICGNEWYYIDVIDFRCLGIVGEAVVLGNTIYALTCLKDDVVVALSIEEEGSGADLVFKCSIRSEILIPDLISMFPRDNMGGLPWVRTTHFVHLGKLDFCIVRSCGPLKSEDPKPIHVTYMRLTGETKMTVLSNHWFKTRYEKLSEVVHCFSLPKCKTTALEEGKRFVFELNPFINQEQFPSIDRAYKNLVQEETTIGPVVKENRAKMALKQQGRGAAADFNAGSGSWTDSGPVRAHHTTSPQPAASSIETKRQPTQEVSGLNSLTPDQCCSVMDDSEPGSLFVVVFYDNDPSFSILHLGPEQIINTNVDSLQLETLGNLGPEEIIGTSMDGLPLETLGNLGPEEIIDTNVDGLKEHVVGFDVEKELPPIRWSVSPPISCNEDLYLLPDWCDADKPLHGYKFNFRTGSFQNICLPPSIQKEGEIVCAVNHGGRIYRMEVHTLHWPKYYLVESVFDCYDPVKNSWKSLKPFPPYTRKYRVRATAVWGDTILFRMDHCGLWAYDVYGNEWYHVNVMDSRCYSMVGEAVVVESTIYAFTGRDFDAVVALSIEKEGSGGDLVFKCTFRSEIRIPDLISMFPRDKKGRRPSPNQVPWVRTKHLVHLGKLDFCLVRGCGPLKSTDPKPIHVTYMRLTGETKMTVLSNHWFKIRYDKLSEVLLCFYLPKCKTTAVEEGKQFVFKLDPFTPEASPQKNSSL